MCLKNRTGLFYFEKSTIRNLSNKYSSLLLPNGCVGRRFIYYNCYILYVGGIDITCGIIFFADNNIYWLLYWCLLFYKHTQLKCYIVRWWWGSTSDFGPAKAVGRSQTRPVEDLGPHHYLVRHQWVDNIMGILIILIDIIILCIIRIGFHVISIPFHL